MSNPATTYVLSQLPASTSEASLSEKKRQHHETPEDPNKKKAKKELNSAGEAACHILPTVTCGGLAVMFDTKGEKGIVSGLAHIFGFFMAVSGLIIDPIKAPIAAGFSLKGLLAAGYYGIKSLVKGKPADHEQIQEIVASFELRCAHTLRMLVALGLETSESLQEKFSHPKGKGTRSLYALTTLSTALASRGYSTPAISLANGKILHREDCPAKGLEIFDQVIMIRDILRAAGLHQKTNRQVMCDILRWVPLIKEALDRKIDFKVLMKEKIQEDPQWVIPSADALEMVGKIVTGLLKIGKKSQGLSALKESHERLQWEALRQVSAIPVGVLDSLKEEKGAIPSIEAFVDHSTYRPLTHAAIGSDGYFYNLATAQALMAEFKLDCCIVIHAGGGPKKLTPGNPELSIDPILMEEIVTRVVGDDGLFYEESTAQRMIQNKSRGPIGIVLKDYITCREVL